MPTVKVGQKFKINNVTYLLVELDNNRIQLNETLRGMKIGRSISVDQLLRITQTEFKRLLPNIDLGTIIDSTTKKSMDKYFNPPITVSIGDIFIINALEYLLVETRQNTVQLSSIMSGRKFGREAKVNDVNLITYDEFLECSYGTKLETIYYPSKQVYLLGYFKNK